MGIDTLSKDTVHVQDLGLEKPKEQEREFSFDGEKDIPHFHVDSVISSLKYWHPSKDRYIDSVGKRILLDNAIFLKQMFPDKFAELGMDKDLWEMLQKVYTQNKEKITNNSGLRRDLTGDYYLNFAESIANTKIMFPEKLNELYPDIKEMDKDKQYLLAGFIKNKRDYANKAMTIFEIAANGLISKTDFIKEHKKSMEQSLKPRIDKEHWVGLVNTLYFLKIMNWEGSIGSIIGPTEWKKMKYQLLKPGSIKGDTLWLDYACQLYYLAADEIKITDESFEVVEKKLPQEHKNKVLEMPEERVY